jgi:hypothetical protein
VPVRILSSRLIKAVAARGLAFQYIRVIVSSYKTAIWKRNGLSVLIRVACAISKATLDVAFCHKNSPSQFSHDQFDNNSSGFKKLATWLKRNNIQKTDCFICMEHTGHYTLALCCFLQKEKLSFSLVSPLHLKKSAGLTRGKNDRGGGPQNRCKTDMPVCLFAVPNIEALSVALSMLA